MNFAKNTKVVSIPLDNVRVNFDRNFARERNEQTYNDPNLRQDFAARGQITPAMLLEIGKDTESGEPIYEPMQGNRRAWNLKKAKELGIEDPSTCKVDDKGNPIAGTGKVFNTIKAVVFKGLSERERVEIMADHGNVRGLSRAELQLFIEGLFDVGYTEKDVARLAGNLLLHHYPPKRELKSFDEDKGADFLSNYRGVIQAAKNRWRSPKLLHEQAMQVLRGKQNWPTKAEISEGLKVFETEVDADRTGKLDRETPGPKFIAWFEKLLKAKNPSGEDGGATGNGKPRPISMMNRAQLEELLKVTDSRLLKFMINVILRDERVQADKLPIVAKLGKKAERGEAWTAEDQEVFDECWNTEPSDSSVAGSDKPDTNEVEDDGLGDEPKSEGDEPKDESGTAGENV